MGVLSNNNAQIVPGALISASYVSDIYSVLMGEEREDIMLSGSLNVTGSIYGTLIGTASYVSGSISNADSASYALTASYAENAGGIDTGSLITTSSFESFTSSYYTDSSSFDIRIITNASNIDLANGRIDDLENFSSSIDTIFTSVNDFNTFTASYHVDSASFDTRTVSLENFSSSISVVLDDIYATDSELNSATASLENSITTLSGSFLSASSSFDTRILDNSSSIDLLNSEFTTFSGSYNTGSFTGSFNGILIGTADVALNSNNADLLDNRDSSTFANTGSNVFAGNQEISGSLQLNPTADPGNFNIDSSFLFVSTSADNTEFNLHYRNNGALWETHWLEERTDTGLVWGGVVTFSGTTMFITPGAGLIVNHNANTGSHGDTQATYVTFGPITASATFISSSQVTYLLIDTDGSLIQQTSIFTPQQYNEKLPLGYIFCLTTSSISSYADARVTTYGQDEQQSQFIRAFGPLKINGYDLTPQSGSLRLSIGAGRAYRAGGFYSQNPQNPSVYDSDLVATGSFVRVYRDPAVVGGFKATLNGFVPFTTIDPTMYDDGTGTLASVGAGEWTIQRLFQGVVNGITYVYYGQNKYDSLAAAIQSINTEPFEESPTSILALPFIGYVITKGDTTNLSDTANNKIINSGLFRNTAGSSGGGGVATTNINDLADVDITTPSTGQALIYNAGVWQNGTPLNATSSSFSSTASYVENAQTASYVLSSISSSFTTTASFAQTASYIPELVGTQHYVPKFDFGYGLTNSQIYDNGSNIQIGLAGSGTDKVQIYNNTDGYTALRINQNKVGDILILQTSSKEVFSVATSGLIKASGSFNMTGSITVTPGVINNLTSSYAITSSYVENAQTASFVTLAQTASFVTTAQTASYILNAVSSSFSSTSSFASTSSFTPNAIITASAAGDVITFTKDNGTTFPIQVLATISGSGSVQILDEGSSLTTGVTSINFSGSLISATNVGSAVTVRVPGLTYTAISSSTPQALNSTTFTLLTGTNIIPAAGTYLVHSVVYGTVGTNNAATLETALYYNAVQQPATIGIIGGDGSLQAPISTQMILISNGVSTFEVRGRVTTSVGTAEGYYITLVKIA